ncbi:MAG: DUF4394 domain-containing protein [Thermoanaerobaculia bacterium]
MRIARLVTFVLFAFGTATVAVAETIYVSTTSRLQSFSSSAPGTLLSNLAVTGMAGGETLEGIDFRPATGELYGLGSNGQLYRIAPLTGVATPVGIAVALSGSRFGMDFNPTVDRIRIVSDNGSNIRRHPDTGALAATDTNLAFAVGDVNAGQVPSVLGVAYTNSLGGATTTVLYDLDFGMGVLATQLPPNNGTLNTIGEIDFGAIGGFAGFDISSQTGTGWAAFDGGSGTQLYRVDLDNGRASARGAISGSPLVTGLAVALTEGPCLPSSTALCLLGDRFRVTATYETAAGATGAARVTELSNEAGNMTFFSSGNIEATVKVIDGCAFNGYYWVYASGLTNVEVDIIVRDEANGHEFPIHNPLNQLFDTVASIEALPCD